MKKRFTWTGEARSDLRRIRKEQALSILKAMARFAAEGAGDVKKLIDDPQQRFRFRSEKDTIHVLSVEDRREACR